jgi:hypothetical protein
LNNNNNTFAYTHPLHRPPVRTIRSNNYINQRRPSKKLANKYISFLPIIKIIEAHRLVYRVKFPEKYRMYNAFSIGLLEPYNGRDNVVPAI